MMECARLSEADEFELRLFLEELCCNLCWFLHSGQECPTFDAVTIDQEAYLGSPGAFADICVRPAGLQHYFVEVKYGYSEARLFSSISRKYARGLAGVTGASKVVLVMDTRRFPNWPELEARLRQILSPRLELEIWDEASLSKMVLEAFDVRLPTVSATNLLDLREAIDRSTGRYAFGDDQDQRNQALERSLLWHFGFRRVRRFRDAGLTDRRSILVPGLYRDAVVLLADLTSFSSFVRDSPDEQVVRSCLTSFYAKSRYQIINCGGMLYQFLGDAAMAFFGLPDQSSGYVEAALQCARALAEIGESVSNEWQRQIDRVQDSGGVHVSMAVGDLQVMSLRPFSRVHLGVIGDAINLAARLNANAASGEIVVSNRYYQRLGANAQGAFEELGNVQAKNVGLVRAWKSHCRVPSACRSENQ